MPTIVKGEGPPTIENDAGPPSISTAPRSPITVPAALFSATALLDSVMSLGASFTGVTSMVTVATLLSAAPSLALNWNCTSPSKSAGGV